MKPINRKFEYTKAEDSRKPGYLAMKFRRIRQEQAQAQAESAAKVTPMPRKAVK